MSRVRGTLLLLGLMIALIVVNLGIASRERLLREGATVLLELAPVDPRSMMQGDYMALDFALARMLPGALDAISRERGHGDGYAVLTHDDRQVARFVRVQPEPTPRAEGEIVLRYRLRGGWIRLVTNAWFFPEGQAQRYQPARYGELRVGDDGEALLVALRDGTLKPL